MMIRACFDPAEVTAVALESRGTQRSLVGIAAANFGEEIVPKAESLEICSKQRRFNSRYEKYSHAERAMSIASTSLSRWLLPLETILDASPRSCVKIGAVQPPAALLFSALVTNSVEGDSVIER